MPSYDAKWFHESVADKIQSWVSGEGKNRLMIFLPPQHGKSQLSTRHTPSWILGHDPNAKVAIAAYNSTFASKFNRDIQRIIETKEYKNTFPETKLSGDKTIKDKPLNNYVRNSDEFEIVGKTGGLVSVGVGGGLTGRQVDYMIIDDVYKDAQEAWSPVTRQKVADWYNTVVETRLHNDSKVLIVFTRWHEQDLAGTILDIEEDKWEVIKLPAIKTSDVTDYDPRDKGDALWPEKHNLEKLEGVRKKDNHSFESLYQQNPKPIEGLLYSKFREYTELPDFNKENQTKSYVDTADTGNDYLCSIVYRKQNHYAYVIDVIYTQSPQEVTENSVSNQFTKFDVNIADIESNNGGRAFARNIDRICKELGNKKTVVNWFHQSQNKESRIFSNASTVQNTLVFPNDWAVRWPQFYLDVTRFQRKGKNKNDDAPDTMTGVIEKMDNNNFFVI